MRLKIIQACLLVISIFSVQLANAQVNLVAGDIAFIGWNTDSPDAYAFITLTDIPGGTKIYFTDKGLQNPTNWATSSEDTYLFTAPVGGISCGTTITITDTEGAGEGVSIAGVTGATCVWIDGGTSKNFNLSAGDQMIAYQTTSGIASTPTDATFIAGVHGDDGNGSPSTSLDPVTKWNALSPSIVAGVSRSEIPNGLTNGVNCVSLFPSIGAEEDNAKYTGSLTGTSSALRSAINDYTNWSTDNDTPFNISPGAYSPSVTCVATAGSWDGSTSTDWNVASNWTGNVVPTSADNITIPSAPSNQPHVTLDPGSPAVCNDITIDAGATLTIDAGKALTISGTLANAGTVDIKADATGIGSLITNGTISGAGSFKMEQYLTGSGGGAPDGVFYYVSCPIPNATAADYNVASGNKLWIDDEPNQSYPQLTFGAIPLEVGQGYIARMGSTGAVEFDGSSYNTGSVTEGGLTRTGTTETNRGYNLIGNPYPSTVSWDDASRTNLETTIWYRTNNAGTMTFDTYNAAGMVGTSNNGGGPVSGDIPPSQAVWVRVSADGLTGSVSFDNADRSHGMATGIYKVEAEEGTVRLTISNGTISDEQIILFNTDAADQFDDYDSHKFWAADIPQLYTNINEDTLTINGLNSTATNPTVPLGIKLPTSGNYSIDASSITLNATPVYLEDTYLNVFQDLNQNATYSFSEVQGNIGDRFILHFAEITGVDEVENNISVYSFQNQIKINLDSKESGHVTVFDLSGRTVLTRQLNSDRTSIELNQASGIYLVRVETQSETVTRKVAIN